MTLTQLRYFLAVVRYGSISAAAQHIHIAQPALSQRLKLLEEELGEVLFQRHSRGVTLTSAGEFLYPQALDIIQRVDLISQTFSSPDNQPAGAFRLGLATAVNTRLCVPVMQRCREYYPKVQLTLSESMSGTLLEWVLEGKVDIAVVYDVPVQNSLDISLLDSEQLYLVASPVMATSFTAPIQLEQVLNLPLILPAFPQTLRLMVEQTCQSHLGTIPSQVLEVDSTYAIKKLVAAQEGYSILSRHSLEDELKRGELTILPFAPGLFRRSINVVHRKDQAGYASLRALRLLIEGAWHDTVAVHRAIQPV